jgi:5,6,7,8-tetrahydromethanopterin hydro-lyase
LNQDGREQTTIFFNNWSTPLGGKRGLAARSWAVMIPFRALAHLGRAAGIDFAALETSTGDVRDMATDHTMHIGEALAGEGNEVAHIDLLIGSKSGPVGYAFAHALSTQSEGHSNLLAVLTPNLIAKPATVLITKVTIKGAKQAVQMFGPAQYAVAKAVADCVADGTIPAAEADELVIICGVFIHWDAADNAKIQQYNYEATKLAIQRAMKNQPTSAEITASKDTVKHPFA